MLKIDSNVHKILGRWFEVLCMDGTTLQCSNIFYLVCPSLSYSEQFGSVVGPAACPGHVLFSSM